jgi:acyl carrier protein
MSSAIDELTNSILPGVIEIIIRTGNLGALRADQDFYDAGVTSVMALPILLDIEDRYGVSIPDGAFIGARTPQALAEIIAALRTD